MRISVSLPWRIEDNPLEIITIPILGLGTIMGFMAFIFLLVPASFPAIGLEYWYTAAVLAVSGVAFVTTCLYGGLRLTIDFKVFEFIYSMGGLILILGGSRFFDPFARENLRFALGIILGLLTWWVSTVMGWACSRTLPPPDEGLLDRKAEKGTIELLVGGRLEKALYRRNEEGAVHLGYFKFLRQLMAVAAAFGVAFAQYAGGRANPWMFGTSILTLGIFIFCGLTLGAVMATKSRRVQDEVRGTIMLGSGASRQVRHIMAFMGAITLICIAVPGRLSPIAMKNLDNISWLMGVVIQGIFGRIYGDSAYRDIRLRPNGGKGGGMVPLPIPIVNNGIGGVFDYLTVILAVGFIVGLILFIRYWRRRHKLILSVFKTNEKKIPMINRFLAFTKKLILTPLAFFAFFLSWIRFLLLPDPVPDTGEEREEKGIKAIWKRTSRRVMDFLLPDNPGALIRALYARLLSLGRKYGVERGRNMTANEYARMLQNRSQAADPGIRELLDKELGILTSAYVSAKYTPRTPGKPLAERAMNALRALQSSFRKGAVKPKGSTEAEKTAKQQAARRGAGDGSGRFRL